MLLIPSYIFPDSKILDFIPNRKAVLYGSCHVFMVLLHLKDCLLGPHENAKPLLINIIMASRVLRQNSN